MIPAITEVNFPQYATLHQATASFQEMGDRTITTQVRIDGDVVPSFDGWELRFKGERFILDTKEPQAAKDNTTRNAMVDLVFVSWVINELKRYYFFEPTAIDANTAIADKYKASVGLNLEDFVALFNKVLNYYFGGKVVMSLATGSYSQDRSYIDIDYTYVWDVLTKMHEVYGERWYIAYNSTTDVYTIKVGYQAPAITDHDFEYGYQGGLLRFERQVQDADVRNILLGRGGEKNLPYRYFKLQDPQNPDWAEDPDAIPELANIYFDRLRDINFRWYVRGWMQNAHRDTSWDSTHTFPSYTDNDCPPAYLFAFQKGKTDEKFNPVEYVKDDDSIAAYGERWGAVEDNDEAFPTIQGVSRSPIGRIDETVAVSEIVTDDIGAMSKTAAVEKSINPMTISVYGNTGTNFEIMSEVFTIPSGSTGNVSYTPLEKETVFPAYVHYDTENTTLVAVNQDGGAEVPISGIPAGTYRLKLNLVISRVSPAPAATGTFGIENIVLTTSDQNADAWKPTFDIWVKNIWNTTKASGESDEQYAERVWLPILGDRAGNEAKIVFSTGFMSVSEDYEFVIAKYPVRDTTKEINGVPSEWRITLRKSDAEFDATGLYIPNATTGGAPAAGDKFFFTGIDMPHMYVELSEEDLNTAKSAKLDETAVINPTWVISLDKVRCNTLEDGEYGQTLADRLSAGAKVWIKDPRFTPGERLQLYVQSITYTWNEPTDDAPYLVPDIEVVLSDKVVSTESVVGRLQGEIDVVKEQYARISDVEAAVRSVAEPLFLKKTGESDSSDSPTQFASKVTSKGFRQGGIGGSGWGLYRDNTADMAEGDEDAEGDSVIEADRVVVRKAMEVNSLVVNQIEALGGKEILSAAKIEVTKVIEDNDSYVCYFNQRQNSVANLFAMNDIALGQVFNADNTELRYYKMLVTAVGLDCITLAKANRVGSGSPQVGDIIVQFGSTTNSARQYVIVRDVIGGGYERMLSGLNALNSDGVEYFFAGYQSTTGPRWFVGAASGEYAEWSNGRLNIKGTVLVKNGGQYTDMSYLAQALPSDSTIIQGGLVLSKVIALRDAQNNIKSGINGDPGLSQIAAWYGGPMADAEATPAPQSYAKSLFRFDGSGYLAGGKIHWAANGSGAVPGLSWNSSGTQITLGAGAGSAVVISGGVQLGSDSADTVTSVLAALQNLPTTYVDFASAQTISGVKTFTNGIKIGDATLTWVPGDGGAPGHLHIDQALVTEGDQIVQNGTPGGGGGGSSYLWELLDVDDNLQSPAAGALLQYDSVAGLWKGNAPATQIGVGVTGFTTGALIRNVLGDDFNAQWSVKQFINSSIATATATFRGTNTTATTESAFLTWANGLTHDLNDYVFWKTTDSLGNTVYKRYKYDGSQWVFEYELNNSSFTSEQWDAINSGITSGKVGTYDTVAGYFSGGKILSTALPAMYIGDAQVKFSAQTSQDVGGLGNLTMANATYLRAYNTARDTLYNLAGLNASNYGYLGAANSPRTYMRGKSLYFLSGDSGNTSALVISTSQNATFYGALYLQNNKQIYWKNAPAAGADAVNLGLLNLSSSNVFTLGSGLIATGDNARAYNTYIYGASLSFYTGSATTGAVRKWMINSSGNLYPYADKSYNLGAAANYIKEAYIGKMFLAPGVYIEYVPASGDTPGYVHISSHLLTDGDQIVKEGVPGGGGGGGSEYLWELEDVDNALITPSNGVVLQYNATAGKWKGVASDTIGITTAGTVAELNAASPTTAKRVWSPSVLASWLSGKNYVENVAIGTGANAEKLAVTRGGSTSYLTVPYATNVVRFKRYEGVEESEGYDLNTLLSGGGITSQYGSMYYWANAPANMSFGGAVQVNAQASNSLAMQLAWDVVHNRTQGIYQTGKLWWRDATYHDGAADWGAWHLIYDDTTLTKSVVTGLLDAGNGTYLPLSGGTMSGDIIIPSGKYIRLNASTAMLGLSSGGVFYCGPGDSAASFLLRSGNVNLIHRKYTGASTYNDYAILDASIAYISSSAVTMGSNTVGSSDSPIGYATRAKRPFAVTPTQEAGAIDLNTILAGGGATRNVWNKNYWAHAPSGATYFGMAYQINPTSVEDGAMQFYWDGTYTGATPTGGLWWRLRNNTGWADDWHRIYDSANANLSTIDWNCKDLHAYGIATIGTATAITGATLTVDGAFASTGDQSISSDATLKKNWRPLKYGIAEIAKATAGVFDWKDGKGSSAGTKAQDWMHLVPQLVHGREGCMTLAYGQIAMLNTILLARGYESQDKKIERLQDRVAELEEEVKRLRAN